MDYDTPNMSDPLTGKNVSDPLTWENVSDPLTWENVSDPLTWENVSRDMFNSGSEECVGEIPTAEVMIRYLTPLGIILLVLCSTLTAFTIGLHIEECYFLSKYYKNQRRRAETMSILSIIPMFSFTSLLALWVPRSSTLTDLVAAAYFGYCLYCFVHLTCDYLGGPSKMIKALEGKAMRLRSGPCCCCCCCLPTLKFNRKRLRNVRLLVLQTSVLKPLLMLIAAVLWTDGSYHPGSVDPFSISLYINSLNIMSTMFAMYGLNQLLRVSQQLLPDFSIRAKFLTLQLILITTSTLAMLCGWLVKAGLIPCIHPFSSSERADRLCHILIIFVMIPFSVMARLYYLREKEYKTHERCCMEENREVSSKLEPDDVASEMKESHTFLGEEEHVSQQNFSHLPHEKT